MSTRERILTIRLLEKVGKCPAYAQALGIKIADVQPEPVDPADESVIG